MTQPTLYHFAYSTCSQKVRMVFAEKGVAFVSCEVDLTKGEQHSPDYVKLNPDHVVPTLVVGEHVLIESTLIAAYVDDAYDGPALRPADPLERYRSEAIVHHVDNRLHGKVTGVLTHAILSRAGLSSRTPEERAAYLAAIPDPAERALRTSLITHGAEAPEMAPAIATLARFFARLERDLEGYHWLAGQSFGIADATVLPYVVRFEEMGLDAFWSSGARPAVERWLERSKARPSFGEAFTAWTPAPVAANFAAAGAAARPVLDPLIDQATKAAA